MSRIGKLPISLPKGVEVVVDGDNVVTVKGKLGTLTQKVDPAITVGIEGEQILLTRATDQKQIGRAHV